MMESPILRLIGSKVREIRKSKGITQEQLAEMADTHHSYIGSLERGERNATIQSLEKIAKALRVNFFDLFEHSSVLSELSEKNELIRKILVLLIDREEDELKRAYNILLEVYKR